MNDSLITVITVNFNASDFILNMLYCLKKLTKNKYKVIIRDNNSKKKDYLKLKKFVKYFSNVYLYRVEDFDLAGSIAHGTALNDLIPKIDTKYGVIIDPDCTFLHKNWDEILINQINEEYPIIGTQAPGYKYQDFPYVFALFFITDIMKKLKIDFKPENVKKGQDTGFLIREKFLANGYKGKLLINRYTKNFKSIYFKNVLCQEFYLKGNNNIIASHFWKGSTLGDWKYRQNLIKWISSVPVIGPYLLMFIFRPELLLEIGKFRGRVEKYRWIKICRDIVKNNV